MLGCDLNRFSSDLLTFFAFRFCPDEPALLLRSTWVFSAECSPVVVEPPPLVVFKQVLISLMLSMFAI